MKTMTYRTALARSSGWAKGLTLATLAVGTWALSAGSAQARNNDVYWSVGVDSPGVSVGVSNAPPPRPVVIQQPAPVIIHQPMPVVVQQPYPYVRPVVVAPRPVIYQGWGYGYGPRWDDRHERRHWRHRHDHDRYDRGDDRWDDGDRGGDRRGDGRR